MGGRGNPNAKTSTPNGFNDLGLIIAAQNQSTSRRIFLHRPPQRRLRLPCELINFHQYDNFVLHSLFLFRSVIYRRASQHASSGIETSVRCHFLDNILYDVTIIDPSITGVQFNMIIAANHVDINGFIGRCFESSLIETKAFSSVSIYCFE